MLNGKGQWEAQESAWGLLEVVWPKPGQWGYIKPPKLLTMCVHGV